MGKESEISWTHHTFNPWWGCQRVSPGCGLGKSVGGCYAESFSKRVGLKLWGPQADRRFFGDKHWNEPRAWNKAAEKSGERKRVFCASMADVFEDRDDLIPHRERLWNIIRETPALDWLILTKRPENIAKLGNDALVCCWLGTTAENQEWADRRIPLLLQHRARVHFVSGEPLLGPLNLTPWLSSVRVFDDALANAWDMISSAEHFAALTKFQADRGACPDDAALSWVIGGGESGAGYREMDLAWLTSLRTQCHQRSGRVAFHVKQDSGIRTGMQGRIPDELWAIKEFP